MKDIQVILRHYLIAVLWTEEEELSDGLSIYQVDEESRAKSLKDIKAFVEKAGDLLEEWPEEQIGHDFWLTRCGHGAGFWDRTEYENGDELTEICKKFEFHGQVFELNGKVIIEG